MSIKIQKVNFKKNSHELAAWEQGLVVCGIDEVGRGCLAGPVVTAAVIMPPYTNSRLIKDSKLLTEPERIKANAWIMQNCWYAVGIVNHRTIDRVNIWQATLIGMKKAVVTLLATCPARPEAILVDAMPLKLADTAFKDIPVHHFPKGEKLSSSIAASSIVAKVMRDNLMTKLDPLLPGYNLGQHKGYSTSLHQAMVKSLNPSILHRQSFLNNIYQAMAQDAIEEQQSIL